MTGQPRRFTRAEDELIVRQSRGEFPIKELRKRLRANALTIHRRAAELGVVIRYNVVGRRPGTALSVQDDLTPARIRNDKLLKRLIEVHGVGGGGSDQ